MKKIQFSLVVLLISIIVVSCNRKTEIFSRDTNTQMRVSPNTDNSCDNVNKYVAAVVAYRFFKNLKDEGANSSVYNIRLANVDSIVATDNHTAMYIFNFSPKGYVITTADVRNEPIFAYSLTGNITKFGENAPEALKTIVEGTIEMNDILNKMGDGVPFEYLLANLYQWQSMSVFSDIDDNDKDYFKNYPFVRLQSDYIRDLLIDKCVNMLCIPYRYIGDTESINTGILLSAKWGQSKPYDFYTPNNYLVGCVAVAMGQIMRFHNHPSWFNYNIMPNSIPEKEYGDMTDGDREVARLLRHIGNNVNMDYSANASSATDFMARWALYYKYGYSGAANLAKFDLNKVVQEITTHRRPIYMSGCEPKKNNPNEPDYKKGGHAFLIDGYKYIHHRAVTVNGDTCIGSSSQFLHFNFGWRGNSDGWYNSYVTYSVNLKPIGPVIDFPKEDANFKFRMRCIYNIYPK